MHRKSVIHFNHVWYGGNGVDLPRQNKISIPRENAFRAGIYKHFALNMHLDPRFIVG